MSPLQRKRPRRSGLRGRPRTAKTGAVLACVSAVLALAVAGCGGDDDGGGAAPPGGGGGATPVELKEFSIEPGGLELERGATLDVQNTGALPHNLTIERTPDATDPSERLAGTSTFGGGEAEELRIDLAPGRYALVCTVDDHRQRGMVGSLTVR